MEYNYKIKHSRLGITSFVIFLTYFVTGIVLYFLDMLTWKTFFMLFLYYTPFMSLVGAILGLVGVIRLGTKTVFASLALILNGLVVLCYFYMILLSL